MLHLAQQLTAAGLRVFPCQADKSPAVPKGVDWRDAARVPPGHPDHNWGTTVGLPVPDDVVVLDHDSYKPDARTLAEWEQVLGCKPDWDAARLQTTQRGGTHYGFRTPAWAVRQMSEAGMDTRVGGKGYICTGSGYEWRHHMGVAAMAYPDTLPPLPDECRAVLGVPDRPERAPSTHPQTADTAQVIEALRHVDPGCDRAAWVRTGCSLRALFADDPQQGLELFDCWSRGEYWPAGCPDNYRAEDIQWQWDSFKADGGVGPGTLFYKAMQSGWQPPAGFDASAAFGQGAVSQDVFNELIDRIRETGGDPRNTEALIHAVQAAQCNRLQVVLLSSEIKQALADAGNKDKQVLATIDQMLTGKAAARPSAPDTPADGLLDPNTPLHPDHWLPYQTKGKEQRPKGTEGNFDVLLKAYGLSIQFDEVLKTITFKGPSVPCSGTLHDEAALSHLESLANLNEFPAPAARSLVTTVANLNVVNPVLDYTTQARWDGLDHVGALWAQIELEPDEDPVLCETLFRKWLRGAYAIGTGRIKRWEHVIVLVDPKGGAGKTRFFATLCPPELRADSVVLDTSNKDNIKIAISRWLVELGELDGTFTRSDQAKLKAFLSQERDEMRMPYGRAYLQYPRRTAFFASVNETRFMVDHSGNRRWWALQVRSTNYRHTVDVTQVWAQVAEEVRQGYECFLTRDEEAALILRNEGFRQGSRVADLLSSAQIDPTANGEVATVTELLILAGLTNPSKAELNEAARWLRQAGFVATARGGRRGFFYVPRTAEAFQPTNGTGVTGNQRLN